MLTPQGKEIENMGLKERKYTFEEMKKILDNMVATINVEVRARLAYEGYRLDILAKDLDEVVRRQCAVHKETHDLLVNDSSIMVRCGVARNCDEKHLAILVDDPSPDVRVGVAYRGYGLEKLATDDDILVRATARDVLNRMNNEVEKC